MKFNLTPIILSRMDDGVNVKVIRQWAVQRGMPVSEKGRLKRWVIDKYNEAVRTKDEEQQADMPAEPKIKNELVQFPLVLEDGAITYAWLPTRLTERDATRFARILATWAIPDEPSVSRDFE